MKIFSFKPIRYSLMVLMSAMVSMLSAQVTVSLERQEVSASPEQQCYHIHLRNIGKSSIALAGQNYRMYYDSEHATFDESSITSFLPGQYTSMKLVQHHYDADASGFGILPYESHLGFINLATDLNLDAATAHTLPVGKDVAIAQLCFNVSDSAPLSITWAQDRHTHTYATAFVELALMDDGGKISKAQIGEYKVVTNRSVDVQKAIVYTTKYFPNPFTDALTVSFNEPLASKARVQISSVFGAVLQTIAVEKGATEIVISGRDLPEGALLIDVKSEDGLQSTMKAIKIK